jgi:hypothetical protein
VQSHPHASGLFASFFYVFRPQQLKAKVGDPTGLAVGARQMLNGLASHKKHFRFLNPAPECQTPSGFALDHM